MKERWKTLIEIFWTFFKISPVTFGGGFAMVPLIEREIVEKRKWLDSEEVADVFALSQTIPGSVAINSATFIGYRIGGVKGALAAMIGVSLPTFLIVLALGAAYLFIHDHPKIEAAFVSIRITIVAIIIYAAIKIAKTAIVDKTTFCIMLAGVPLLFFVHPTVAIPLGALTGVVAVFLKKKMGYKHKKKNDHATDPDYFMGAGI
ncbi:chromate transporter [Neobacillus sp. DY30]|uniref:chromate transporter n=1 Tax=Neobacillus sp. DY30 TaxID=3047871 RepID=UPI0024C01084|nr:chromate transporter [Neobacillus sp. DY30]WHY00171.1 chromate transporter [Neobacillus sp. DY30]